MWSARASIASFKVWVGSEEIFLASLRKTCNLRCIRTVISALPNHHVIFFLSRQNWLHDVIRLDKVLLIDTGQTHTGIMVFLEPQVSVNIINIPIFGSQLSHGKGSTSRRCSIKYSFHVRSFSYFAGNWRDHSRVCNNTSLTLFRPGYWSINKLFHDEKEHSDWSPGWSEFCCWWFS